MKMLFVVLLAAPLWSIDLDTIPDNTWVKLGNVAHSFPASYTGTFSLRFWCTFTWDPDSGRILFYEGYNGSHNQVGSSIYANAVYAFTPADEKVRFINLSTYWNNPTWDTYVAGSGPPTPHPRHTYGAFKYVPKYKSVYMAFGACAHTASCDAGNLWKYHVPSDTWTKITSPLPDNQIGGYDANFAYLPGSDTLWTFTQNSGTWVNLYAFNLATESWSQAINYGVQTYQSRNAAEDTHRGRILYRSATGYHFLNPATGSLVKFADSAGGIPSNPVMAYIPKHDRYFIYAPGSREVWTLNPADTTWTQEVDLNDPGKRIDRYIAYDPVNDVVATFNVDGEYHVFRYKPSGGTREELSSRSFAPLKLTAAPNPFRVRTAIQFSQPLPGADVYIYDIAGKLVWRYQGAKGNEVIWKAEGVRSGLYLLKVKSAGREYSKKLLVKR